MTQLKSAGTGLIEYELTVGLSAMDGRGFYYPSDTAIGKDGRFYVVNRSLESVVRGVRVTMCDIDSEYYGIFGAYGEEDGQFIWPSCAAIDGEGRVYITDEHLDRVSVFDPDGTFLRKWGSGGARDGELDGPSGHSDRRRGHRSTSRTPTTDAYSGSRRKDATWTLSGAESSTSRGG